jgi:hypothetical protein
MRDRAEGSMDGILATEVGNLRPRQTVCEAPEEEEEEDGGLF